MKREARVFEITSTTKKISLNYDVNNILFGHRMTQNRSPSASLVAILDQALFVEDLVRI